MKELWRFILADKREKNEFKKLTIVVRLESILFLFYFFILFWIFMSFRDKSLAILSAVCFLGFSAVFFLSYKKSTLICLWILNIAVIFWIVSSVVFMGWGIGVQHFVFALIMLYFFSHYRHEAAKFAFAGSLCLLRLLLFYYCKDNEPLLPIDASIHNQIQVVNTITIFIGICIVSYIFSSDSRKLEMKLLENNQKLEVQAVTDSLTGLYNRRKIKEYQKQLMQKQIVACVAIGDIDLFKSFNDEYGHDCGDQILVEIAKALANHMEDRGIVCRWGGEEFLLVYEGIKKEEALKALNSLVNDIRHIRVPYRGEMVRVTMTFGIEEIGSDFDEALKKADNKLYEGKKAGRNRIVY